MLNYLSLCEHEKKNKSIYLHIWSRGCDSTEIRNLLLTFKVECSLTLFYLTRDNNYEITYGKRNKELFDFTCL